MTLNKRQQQIITAKEPKIVVLSGAATGKTTILVERVKYLINELKVPLTEIAMITFTNAAAYEMRKRIGEESDQIFIGTVHSLANKFLRGGGYNTKEEIEQERFDELFSIIEKNPGCVKHYKYVLLDEAQDSSEIQYNFILNLINPENFMFVGDPKQSIYEFSGGRPDIFMEMMYDPEVTYYELNENYRNGHSILEFAKNIITPVMEDNSIAMTYYDGEVSNVRDNINYLVSLIKYSDDSYNSWFFLTRTNAQLDEVMDELTDAGIPCDTFKKASLSNGELYQKMEEDTVKVLTIHTAKGLENKNVIVYGAALYSEDERKVSYVAATRAKENLYWCKRGSKKSRFSTEKGLRKKLNIIEW